MFRFRRLGLGYSTLVRQHKISAEARTVSIQEFTA